MSFLISQMNQQLSRRGPDDYGIWINDSMTQGMGMRRLAIIDTELAKQPWQEKHICLCFNGEIYNFQTLRQTLIHAGFQFKTASDTEVVAKAYLHWGTKCFAYFEGMFAISLMDFRLKKLFLLRDINGEKPLYYFINQKGVVWSSELKGLLIGYQFLAEKTKTISKEGLHWFLRLGFVPAPLSIYESILKVKPAQFLSIDLESLKVEQTNYWALPSYSPTLDKATAIQKINQTIQESLQQQISFNHPSGLLLSGGIDSSILAYWLKEINPSATCFSVQTTSNDRFDESYKAQKIAQYLGLRHEIIPLVDTQYPRNLHEPLLYFDEPFADSSAIASHSVFQKVKSDYKIMYGGDGADEIFGGYNRYLMPVKADKIRPILKSIPWLRQFVSRILPDNDLVNLWLKFTEHVGASHVEDIWNISQMGIPFSKLQQLLLPAWKNNHDGLKARFSNLDTINTLTLARQWDKEIALEGDMLVKTDRMSMMHSLEYRTPFLSKSMWELSQQIPAELLIHEGETKYLLKEYHAQLFPRHLRQGTKKGFEVPIADWLNSSLKTELLMLTDNRFVKQQAIFNADEMKHLVRFFLEKPHRYKFQLWIIYCFQHWYKHQF